MKSLIEKIKKASLANNRKKILKNYYSKELRKGKTHRASSLDRLLIYFIFFIVLTFVLTIKSNNLLLSILISVIALYFTIVINSFLSSRSKIKRIDEINEELKKQKLIREFAGFNTEDFNKYIKNLLEEYYKVKVEKAELPLSLKFTKDGDNFGVKCVKYSIEDKVSSREIELFSNELRYLELKDGILITNTYFTEGIREDTNIILLNFDNIVDMLKKLDKYPRDKDMEDYIVDRFLDRRNAIKSQAREFNKRKIIQLYGLCAVFYLLSFFISFPRYYKIMAVLAFVIASFVSGYKITEYIRLKDSMNIDKN